MYTEGPLTVKEVQKSPWRKIRYIMKEDHLVGTAVDKGDAILFAVAPEMFEQIKKNNDLLLMLIHDQVVREDYIAEYMGPMIRDNNLLIVKAKGES